MDSALISREIWQHPDYEDKVIVDEVWDMTHPQCPFVTLGQNLADKDGRHHYQSIMTRDEARFKLIK